MAASRFATFLESFDLDPKTRGTFAPRSNRRCLGGGVDDGTLPGFGRQREHKDPIRVDGGTPQLRIQPEWERRATAHVKRSYRNGQILFPIHGVGDGKPLDTVRHTHVEQDFAGPDVVVGGARMRFRHKTFPFTSSATNSSSASGLFGWTRMFPLCTRPMPPPLESHGYTTVFGRHEDVMTRKRRRIARGVYRDQWGVSATVKVAGTQREKRFPSGTPLRDIRRWQGEIRVALRAVAPRRPSGSFKADGDRYLAGVRAMPTYRERERTIHLWVAEFGAR